MGFSRQEYWSGLPFPPPGDLPHPEIKPASPALQADALPSELPGKPALNVVHNSRRASGTWKAALVPCLIQSRCSVDYEYQECEQRVPLTASAGALRLSLPVPRCSFVVPMPLRDLYSDSDSRSAQWKRQHRKGLFQLILKSIELGSLGKNKRLSESTTLLLFFLFKKFYWSIVDLQSCVNLCCTVKWLSYIFFFPFFPIVVYHRVLNIASYTIQ